MKKPNKIYRKLGGKRSRLGSAFAAVFSPKRALRDAFGRDRVARDAAENFAMDESKHGIRMVLATLKSWNAIYRGPRVSAIFSALNGRRRPVVVDNRSPEMD